MCKLNRKKKVISSWQW